MQNNAFGIEKHNFLLMHIGKNGTEIEQHVCCELCCNYLHCFFVLYNDANFVILIFTKLIQAFGKQNLPTFVTTVYSAP
jgi:hypothetical protein